MDWIIAALFAWGAHAAPPSYDLKMRLTVGSDISTPQILVKAGEAASISTSNIRISVVAGPSPDGHAIRMRFVISKDGQVLGRPEVTAMEREESMISQGDDFQLNVTATKVENF